MKMLTDKLQHLATSARELLWPNVSTPIGLLYARIWATIGPAWLIWITFKTAELSLSDLERKMRDDLGPFLSEDHIWWHYLNPNGGDFGYFLGTLLAVVLAFVLYLMMARARSIIACSVGLLMVGCGVIGGAIEPGEMNLGPYVLCLLAFLGAINGLRGAIATRRTTQRVALTPVQDTTAAAQAKLELAEVQTPHIVSDKTTALAEFWTIGAAAPLFLSWWMIVAARSGMAFYTEFEELFVFNHHFDRTLDSVPLGSFVGPALFLLILAGFIFGVLLLLIGLISLVPSTIVLGAKLGLFPDRWVEDARSFKSALHIPSRPAPTNPPPSQELNGTT
jgi:hypothetical protein